MASSTTIDIANVKASRVNKFKVKPEKYKIIPVPTMDVGIEKRILIAAGILPKNKKQTKIKPCLPSLRFE